MTHGPLLDALVGDAELAPWFSDTSDVRAMLAFELALAGAQAQCGLVPAAAAAAIAEACAAFEPDWGGLRAGMAKDGVAVPALVAALRARLDPSCREWLHFRATSQDAVDTSLTLRLKPVVATLDGRLAGIVALLERLGETQGSVGLMGHTRMRRALPITAADKVASWRQPLERHRQRLARLAPDLLVVQFGGPVGTRTGLDGRGEAVARGLAERLGLVAVPSWHGGRDRLVAFGQWLALVAGSLGKIGLDVALLSQEGVGSVRLAAGGGSSAMPHKANPVAAEVLATLARYAAGQSGTLAQALLHENERSGAAWTLEWMLLPPLAIATGASLRHAEALLRRLAFVAGADR